MSTDKDKYGIRLRAEPDHMVLGKRLKGAFKAITASIKELSSERLEAFQKTGVFVSEYACVCSHVCQLGFFVSMWTFYKSKQHRASTFECVSRCLSSNVIE